MKEEQGCRCWVVRNSSSLGLLKSWARVTELVRCQLKPRLPTASLDEKNKRSSQAFQGSFCYQMFSFDPLGCWMDGKWRGRGEKSRQLAGRETGARHCCYIHQGLDRAEIHAVGMACWPACGTDSSVGPQIKKRTDRDMWCSERKRNAERTDWSLSPISKFGMVCTLFEVSSCYAYRVLLKMTLQVT
jgi:hypothetical protein